MEGAQIKTLHDDYGNVLDVGWARSILEPRFLRLDFVWEREHDPFDYFYAPQDRILRERRLERVRLVRQSPRGTTGSELAGIDVHHIREGIPTANALVQLVRDERLIAPLSPGARW